MGDGQVQLRRRICFQLFMALYLIFFVQCSPANLPKTDLLASTKTEVPPATVDTLPLASPEVNYHLISTKDSSEWLLALPPGDTLMALLALNRIDRSSLLKLDTLVFPDTIGTGIDLYAPFPKNLDELSKVRKILIISHYAQAFAVYENGIRVRWGPASLGKESTPTPNGLFAANWKSKSTISTVNSDWVMEWYFNIDNFRGVSIHQYALPGYPASHSCVRLYKKDAFWLYNWIDQWVLDQSEISAYGTPVIIYGAYPFDERKPWWLLADNNKALEITPSEMDTVLNDFLPIILERQAKRDSLIPVTNDLQVE